MNSTPPPLSPPHTPLPGPAKRSQWPALFFLATGLAPALVALFLIFGTHYKGSSVDQVLARFFVADTVCALVSGFGIAFIATRHLWLRLLMAFSVAAGLWVINAMVGLFAGCVLTTPGR
jgi:hypothetical protein